MPYITRTDLEQRFGADEVAQRESALASGGLDTVIADAGSMIDGYLATRYTLPLADVPEQLVAVACSLVRYKLLGDAVTERASNDYADAVSWLRDVSRGTVTLQQLAPVSGNGPQDVVMAAPTERVFTRSTRL